MSRQSADIAVAADAAGSKAPSDDAAAASGQPADVATAGYVAGRLTGDDHAVVPLGPGKTPGGTTAGHGAGGMAAADHPPITPVRPPRKPPLAHDTLPEA